MQICSSNSWIIMFILSALLCCLLFLSYNLFFYTYMFVILHPTGFTIRLRCTKEYTINDVKPNPLRSYIVTRDIVEFLLLVIVSFELLLFVPNLNPSPYCLTLMLFQNLLPNILPVLLLKHRFVKAFNHILYQFYEKFGGNIIPLYNRKTRWT